MGSFSRTRRSPGWFLAGLGILFVVVEAALAGSEFPTSPDPAGTEFFEIQATVMELRPEADHLIAAEKTIELIDFLQGYQRFTTMLRDAGGTWIGLKDLKVGQWVFIRGFQISEDRIAAREIYRLPRKIPRRDQGRYPFMEEVPLWEPR